MSVLCAVCLQAYFHHPIPRNRYRYVFGFIEDTINKLEGKKIGLLRGGSGFYGERIFRYLEGRDEPISYIIAARLYKPVQMKIAGQKARFVVDNGIEIGEAAYSGIDGQRLRRMMIVRQHIKERPKAAGKQLRLFQDSGMYNNYWYHCFITNLTLPAQQVWNLYRHRADAENRIKGLKYDFGFDSFNMRNFYGTEAALNMVMMAYNLIT